MGLRTRAVLLAVWAGSLSVSGCASTGTVGSAAAGGPWGPVQDLDVTGTPTVHWTASSGPVGALGPPPPSGAVTGCYSWADPDTRLPVWAARVSGTSGGHTLRLDLEVDRRDNPPLGTHPTAGAHNLEMAVLTVDGVVYPDVHVDPSDAMPSYFTLDGDGTTGLVSIRFAREAGGPQTYLVQGRWRCA